MDTSVGIVYEYCEGLRKGSRLLYLVDDKQIFKKKSFYRSKTTYACYKVGCPAKVTVEKEICQKVSNTEHNHDQDQESDYLRLKVLTGIKNDTVKLSQSEYHCSDSARKAFDAQILNNPSFSHDIKYEKISRNLQRIASQSFPKNPESVDDVINLLKTADIHDHFGLSKQQNPLPFFRGCVKQDDFAYAIFASEKMIDIIKNNDVPRKYVIDATFNVVPKGPFKQLLIIFFDYKEKKYPIIYVLMTKKTKKSYSHLFDNIDNTIFHLEPECFVTDFEKALRSALKEKFPTSQFLGCWFHYCQALRRKIVRDFKPLRGFLKTSEAGVMEFRKIMALPLLPAQDIEPAFRKITEAIEKFDHNSKFNNFLAYFDKQWLQNETPEFFSVFDEDVRTTSAAENYNGQLSRKGMAKGNFFKFIQLLQNEEFFNSNDFEESFQEADEPAKKRRKKKDEERNEKIMYYTDKLKAKKITSYTFLDLMVDSIYEKTFFEFSDGEESDTSNDKFQVDVDFGKCTVCTDADPNIVLLPCRHLKTCNECHLTLQAMAIAKNEPMLCIYCRQVVEDSIQVFN